MNLISANYKKHEEHFQIYVDDDKKNQHAMTWIDESNVGFFHHRRLFDLIDPIIKNFPGSNWLTVGDGRFGMDGHYIKEKDPKSSVCVTDISDSLLKEAHKMGYIDNFKKENAEHLSFSDNQFDFTFCKEAYHHFPRPAIATYEMLRVSKKGIILIEPNDLSVFESVISFLFFNFKLALKFLLRKPHAKHFFETSGNYIFTLSEREMEKLALGMGLEYVAFKKINDVYVEGIEYEKLDKSGPLFKKMKLKIKFLDLLSKIGLQNYNMLCVVLFKENPTNKIEETLVKEGFEVRKLPRNPYL